MHPTPYQFPHVRYDAHIRAYDAAQNNSHVVRFLQLQWENHRRIYRLANPDLTKQELTDREVQHQQRQQGTD